MSQHNFQEPVEVQKIDAALVALQNDQFRRWHCLGERKPYKFIPGKSVWTATFEARDADFKRAAVKAIGEINTFDPGNDPDGFHDFGSVEISGETVWFKIDLFDEIYRFGAEDPTNIKTARRVLTVLFPSDW